MTAPGRLILIRHASTAWSVTGRHTGRTDLPLTAAGEEAASALAPVLARMPVAAAYTSPLQRARRTAELAGLSARPDPDLMEWDYGGYEGLTTREIVEQVGGDWDIWRDGVIPGRSPEQTPGETIEQVADRARAVIDRVAPELAHGDVVLVAHGHLLRILASTWLGQPPRWGAHLLLDAGSVSWLGLERDTRALVRWNLVPPDAEAPVIS